MGFLKRRRKLTLGIVVLEICQSLSFGFSAFSSPSTSVQKSNNSTEQMDLQASLEQDFSDATNAEVHRFVAAYTKNGKDVTEKKEGEGTYIQ